MDIAFLETTQGRLPGQAVMHQDINAVSHVEQVAAETGDDFPVAIVGFQNKDGATGHWMPAPCAHASAGVPVIVGQKIAQESAPFLRRFRNGIHMVSNRSMTVCVCVIGFMVKIAGNIMNIA